MFKTNTPSVEAQKVQNKHQGRKLRLKKEEEKGKKSQPAIRDPNNIEMYVFAIVV